MARGRGCPWHVSGERDVRGRGRGRERREVVVVWIPRMLKNEML